MAAMLVCHCASVSAPLMQPFQYMLPQLISPNECGVILSFPELIAAMAAARSALPLARLSVYTYPVTFHGPPVPSTLTDPVRLVSNRSTTRDPQPTFVSSICTAQKRG